MSRSVLTATQPQVVLQSYLDDLLQEALLESDAAVTQEELPSVELPAEAPVIVEPSYQTPRVVAKANMGSSEPLQKPAALEDTLPSGLAAPVVEAPARALKLPTLPSVAPAILEDQALDVSAPVIAPVQSGLPPKGDAGQTPAWASSTFECLLFSVAGVTMAVPLVCLGSIYLLNEDELTPLFGQPDWFMGIMSTPAGNLKVLETSRWLMPERYREDFRADLKYVISIQGLDWGLAVHQVSRSIRLRPDEVKWRTQRSQRPWLAGTVIEHMCALLDITTMADLIASGATKNKDFLSNK